MFHDESVKHMLIDHHKDRIILYRLKPRASQAWGPSGYVNVV